MRPAKEKSSPATLAAVGKAKAAGSPSMASRDSAGPPGKPRPSSRAPLSNASPAASSSVVPGDVVAAVVAHAGQQRVAARGDQAQEGRLHRRGGEEVRRDVALQVVDRDQREPARGGQPLRRRHADEQRADQAGALGHRHRVDVAEIGPRAGERVVHHRVDELEVVARGDLRHHPAEAVVHALRGHDVGEDLPGAVTTAAQVSSQEVSSARIVARARRRARRRGTRAASPGCAT